MQLVSSGQLIENSVVRLDDFCCNEVKGRKIIIVLGIEVLQREAAKLGNPTNYEAAAVGGAPVNVAPAPSAAYGNPAQNQYQAGAPQANPYMAQQQQPQQDVKPSYQGGYQPPQQQQQQFGGNSAVARDNSNQNYLPIRALNMYQNRWVRRPFVCRLCVLWFTCPQSRNG
jgi:hypothetical protein